MNKPSNGPSEGSQALITLQQNCRRIRFAISQLQEEDPRNEVLIEVEKLGGIGIFAMTLTHIAESRIGPSNAYFAIGYLKSPIIGQFITNTCEGELSTEGIRQICKMFVENL